MPIDQNRIEKMLNIIAREQIESQGPSVVYNFLIDMQPTKEEAEEVSRIARSLELEASNRTRALLSKQEQFTKDLQANDEEADVEKAIQKEVELRSALNAISAMIEKDLSSPKQTHSPEMVFEAIEAAAARKEITAKMNAIDSAIVQALSLWKEIDGLCFKAKLAKSTAAGSNTFSDYVGKVASKN